MLEVTELCKEFPTPSKPLSVLRGVTFQLEPGEALAMMGPSGSGKSTLLHVVGTLEPPTSGSVLFDGTDPFSLPQRKLATFRNRRIGFVFQDHHLLPQCTALENVLVPTLAQPTDDQAEGRARDLLDRIGLADRTEHLPSELSGGEKQRVAIARAFINRPTLLLADEPTGNLDRKNARAVAELFLELQQSEAPMLIVVTHSVQLASRFPRQADLVDGSLQTG